MKTTITSLSAFIFFLFFFCNSILNAQMSWNHAGRFPGTSKGHVAVPNSPSLNITGTFTLEAWINPSVTSALGKGIIAKGPSSSGRYALRILSNRIFIVSNTSSKLISRISNPIPLNTWTHVAGTLDTNGVYKIYINGILDTSSIIANSFPNSGTDSLMIGSTGTSNEFEGMIDEVRVWNTSLNAIQIAALMKSSLGISGDDFAGRLVLSITFQNNTGDGSLFSAMDHSRYANNGFFRNVTAVDLRNQPSAILQSNDCLSISSGGGTFSAPDNSSVSPTTQLTVECWVFPKLDDFGLIYKGPGASNNANYGLKVVSGKLNAMINGTLITSNDSVKKERWSHVAFTFFGATGGYEFFVNGKRGSTGNIAPGNIIDGTDSLYFPLFPSSPNFLGFLDEMRISKTRKTIGEINSQMFTSLNESNDNDSYSNVAYNLDVSTLPNTSEGSRLNLRGTAFFTFNGAFNIGVVQSPINSLALSNFQNGYQINLANKRVPATGTSGIVRDTINILSEDVISDLDLYIALNHSAENNIKLSLTSPVGTTVEFFSNTQLYASAVNIVTVFDSDADSSLISNRYINFGPRIKPAIDFDVAFAGVNPKGKWILTINDETGSDTGFVTAWGLRFNNSITNQFRLECTSTIEAMYNPSTNSMTGDTMTFYLKLTDGSTTVDSSKAVMNSSGTAFPSFTKAQPMTNYFLILKHRNSLETWSATVINFSQLTNQSTYNFADAQSKAYGNNMKQVDTSPLRFAIYSGDVNRDGTVDATDVSTIDNDASNFVSGYVVSDLTGDNFVDGTDFAAADNNAANFVSVIRP